MSRCIIRPKIFIFFLIWKISLRIPTWLHNVGDISMVFYSFFCEFWTILKISPSNSGCFSLILSDHSRHSDQIQTFLGFCIKIWFSPAKSRSSMIFDEFSDFFCFSFSAERKFVLHFSLHNFCDYHFLKIHIILFKHDDFMRVRFSVEK